MTLLKSSGSCLCGAVEIRAEKISTDAGVCHCSMCRKWNGGPFMIVGCGTEVTLVKGEENVSVFNSSDWGERGFCAKCGTHLFYREKANGRYSIPADFFDVQAELKFKYQIFVDEKPAYYSFANKTDMMTGEEIFAKFSGNSE